MRPVKLSPIVLALALIFSSSVSPGQTTRHSTERDQAFALEQQSRDAEAESAWRAILKNNPKDAEACAHIGFIESRQEHYSEAIVFYRRAAALNPSMPGLQLNLGLALFKAGNLRQSIRVFGPMLKGLSPASPDAQRLRILLGMAHYGLTEYAAAVPYLKAAMARDPQNLPYRLVLAESCLHSRQFQCVLDTYHEILVLNPDSAEADMLAGEALDEMRDHAGAIKQFQAAEQADPKLPEVHFGLGYLLWTQSQYDDAAQQFQAQLDLVPNDAEAAAYLADSNVRLNHPDIARPLVEKAMHLNPRLELPYLDSGILDAAAGQNEDALHEFKQAAQLDPTDAQAHWRLARLYQSMGRKNEAKAEFDETRNLNKAADQSVFKKLDTSRAKPPSSTDSAPQTSQSNAP